uniref:Uncharacterized protein n=1 Tax=Anguilla anguilla TaxID=7936 RepID=A0A0E9SMK5_ANGAN
MSFRFHTVADSRKPACGHSVFYSRFSPLPQITLR